MKCDCETDFPSLSQLDNPPSYYANHPGEIRLSDIKVSGPNMCLQGDSSGWSKPPVDLDLKCSAILPGQEVATVAARQLPELSELNQQEVFTILMGPLCITILAGTYKSTLFMWLQAVPDAPRITPRSKDAKRMRRGR